MNNEEAVGEGGEEQAGVGPQLGHQAGGEEAGQGEGGVGEGGAAIKHGSPEILTTSRAYMRLELTLNSSPSSMAIEL